MMRSGIWGFQQGVAEGWGQPERDSEGTETSEIKSPNSPEDLNLLSDTKFL